MATVKTLIGNVKGNPGKDGKDGSENQIYSTDEQVIGKWIDGKPIYRKTMQFSGLSSGENVITHGIKDVDLLLINTNHSFFKTVEDGTGRILLWQFGNSNQSSRHFSQFSTNIVWSNNLTVCIYMGSYIVNKLVSDLIVTFEYTKTTD